MCKDVRVPNEVGLRWRNAVGLIESAEEIVRKHGISVLGVQVIGGGIKSLEKSRWHVSCVRTSELTDIGLRCHRAARRIGSVPRNSSQVSSKPIVCLHFLSASPGSAAALTWLDTLSSFTVFPILPSTPYFYNTIFLTSTHAFQFFPRSGRFPLILVCFRLLPSVSADQSDLQP